VTVIIIHRNLRFQPLHTLMIYDMHGRSTNMFTGDKIDEAIHHFLVVLLGIISCILGGPAFAELEALFLLCGGGGGGFEGSGQRPFAELEALSLLCGGGGGGFEGSGQRALWIVNLLGASMNTTLKPKALVSSCSCKLCFEKPRLR